MGFGGFVLAVVLGAVLLVAGVPLLAAAGGLLIAICAVGLALPVVGSVIGGVVGLFGLLFRFSFGLFGLFFALLGGALMIGLAGAIVSHAFPLLLLAGLVWLVVRSTRTATPPPAPRATSAA